VIQRLLRHKFLRDTSVLQVGAMLNAAGNFLTAIALSHVLGARGQGEFYVAISLYSFLWFSANLGLVSVTVSQVAGATARGDREAAAGWLAYLVKAYLLLGVAVALVGSFALPAAARWILGTDVRVGVLAALLAVTPLIEVPKVVVTAGLQAGRRMLPLAQIENAQEAMRVFLVIVGALVAGGAVGPVVGALAASAMGSLLAVDMYRGERRRGADLWSVREILGRVRAVPLRQGLPLGLRMGAVQNLHAFGTQILPSLFVQRFASSEWVAFFRIAQRILSVPLMFMQGISRTVLPWFSELAGQQELRRLRGAYFKASLFSGLLISAAILVITPLLPWFLELAFPREYREPVWLLARILIPGFMVLSFSIANDTFYLVTGTLRVGIWFSAIGMVVYVALVGTCAWIWPETGVARGFTIAMFWSLWHPLYVYYWFKRKLRPRPAPEALEPGRGAERVPGAGPP